MRVVLQVCIAVIALVLVVFVLYTMSLMKAAKLLLVQANQTLLQMQGDLASVSQEATKVMRETSVLFNNVETKLHAFDPILSSVSQTGEVLTQLSGSAKQVSAAVTQVTEGMYGAVQSNKGRITDVIEITQAGINLWHKLQDLRNSFSQKNNDQKE
jgi:uncharacterized protein YoxC